MTVKNTFNNILNKHQNNIIISLFITLGIVSIIFTSLLGLVGIQNSPVKNSLASAIYQCATGETLSGTNCVSTAITSPIYTEGCESGYIAMDSVCVTFIQRICSDYTEATTDSTDTSLCKINNINNVVLTEITDYDGRQCKGTGYNFKRYNVGLVTNSTAGPIVCSNTISGVTGKANFRFVPRSITSIKNFVTTQTGTSPAVCPIGYTVSGTQCSIAAKISSCSAAGEYLDSTSFTCKSCPANKYCLNSTTGETTNPICPNGGTLIGNLCIADNKIATITYVDGCTSSYVRYDQTCTVEEIRTHDIDACSYYYNSDHTNTLAIVDTSIPITSLNRCSTGGSADFNNSSITKVSDLQCNGTGTAWYNYNVAYDPLVCGNTYDVTNKGAFRWSAKSFTKIVGLQKIGTSTSVCPSGWVLVANSTNCSQAPIVLRFALISDCLAGSFSNLGSTQASNCELLSTSSSSSSYKSGGGGLTITITNQSSSSSSLISSSSSSIKQECSLKPNEYQENFECKPCPSGTVVVSSNPMSIADCITIATVEKPTIRTGGNYSNQILTLTLALLLTTTLYALTKKYQRKFASQWFKVK
jgi:hypothetical protein